MSEPVLKRSLLQVRLSKPEAWHVIVVLGQHRDSLSVAVCARLRAVLDRAAARERHRAFKLSKAHAFRQESL